MSSDRRRFTVALIGTIVALAVAVAGFVVANAVQGPRVVSAAADVRNAPRLAGSAVTFELNEPIDEVDPSTVRVEPASTATTVSVDGATLRVAFDAPLPAATEITVTVAGVTAADGGPATTVRHAFTTADEPLHVLQRRSDSGQDDLVVRSSPANPTPEVMLAAPRIQSFAHAGEVVVAVELLDDGSSVLRLTEGGRPPAATLALPEPGVVRSIAGSTTHPLIGFTLLSDADAASTLYTLDVSGAASNEPRAVLGIDGSPLAVADWLFIPGTNSIVAQDRDGVLFLVDALGTVPPSLLGSHSELRGVLPGTSTLVVADPDRGATIDLTTGETETLILPIAELPENAYPGRVTTLDRDGAHLLEVTLIDEDGGVAGLVARVDASETAVVFAPPEGSRVLSSCASPNGLLVAVETRGADSLPDGYPDDPSFSGTLTSLVEVATGRVVLSLAGGLTDWCA